MSPEETKLIDEIATLLKSMDEGERVVYIAAMFGSMREDIQEMKLCAQSNQNELNRIKWVASGIGATVAFLISCIGLLINYFTRKS